MTFSCSTGAAAARSVHSSVPSIRAARHGDSRRGQRKWKTQRECPGHYWSWGTELNGEKQENLEKRKAWEMARRRGCTGKKTELEAQVKEGFMS